ncbi:uncharacterized protein BDV14DRAFT_165677 [Aspergillus stella-maris]|uniref:uncharacterized protein n=1 Tax=Aspergillus stella-maris TaxID=1810926 RepID=UPI003CCD81BA
MPVGSPATVPVVRPGMYVRPGRARKVWPAGCYFTGPTHSILPHGSLISGNPTLALCSCPSDPPSVHTASFSQSST